MNIRARSAGFLGMTINYGLVTNMGITIRSTSPYADLYRLITALTYIISFFYTSALHLLVSWFPGFLVSWFLSILIDLSFQLIG